jgi:V/A-type H+-transporting ATPase subunit I
MFYFALFLGGVQILFGIFIRIFNITKRDGFKYAFSTLGWFILVLTVIVFNAANKLGWFSLDAMKIPYYILLGISAIMILFLNTPGASIFTRLGTGIWDSYSTVTGLFGDILSYIRLFALGLSSGILGFVFNDIALQFLDIPYIGWLFFLIMLLFGHTLNIFLATLGGFVHPMRLTFVEFYKNAGFKGGGKEYKPFKINT